MPILNRLTWLLLLPFLLIPAAANAQALDAQRKLIREERAALQREFAERQLTREEQQAKLAALAPESVNPVMVEQAQLEVEAARVALESAELDLQAGNQAVQELATAIAELGETLKKAKDSGTPEVKNSEQARAVLKEKQALLEMERQRERSRQDAKLLARQRLALAEEWFRGLQELQRAAQERSQQVALEVLTERLEKQQQEWLAKAARWRSELETARQKGQESRIHLLQARIRDAEERARLSRQRIRLADIEGRIKGIDENLEAPPERLQEPLDQIAALRSELATGHSLLQRRVEVLLQQQQLASRRAGGRQPPSEEIRVIESLIRTLREQLAWIERLRNKLDEKHQVLQAAREAGVRRGLLVRRSLPDDLTGWQVLGEELLLFPTLLLSRLFDSLSQLRHSLARMTTDQWVVMLLLQALFSIAAFKTRRLTAQALARTPKFPLSSFIASTLIVPIQLLQRTGPGLAAVGILFLLIWLADVPEPAFSALLTLPVVWLGVTFTTGLTWALLMSPNVPYRRRRPRLYRQLYWMLAAVGLISALAMLNHLLAIPVGVTNLTDRIFMLFLLLLTLPALETRRLALELLASRHEHGYWMRVTRLLTLLFPLAVLAAAATGVAGYLNLATAIGKYLASFLIALSLWLVLARLLRESAETLKRRLCRSGHDPFWTIGFIAPLFTLLRLALFIGLWSFALALHGLTFDSPALAALRRALEAPLFSIASTSVNLQGLLLTGLALFATIWLSRWIRLVTYRWAYGQITDQGIRHSLSVFTQYAVVLIGLLVTLRLIGLDLTTLAIFAGALGVGIGFGLQNIANNFISGLLLLIERPLRTHDIVRVGEYEGEVTHIGMRSLTVKTWDNQEVIMPNADVIGNAFTNWTRNDNIVRTVLNVGVSYKADPHRVKELIEQALREHPAVEDFPDPSVWLRDFGSSSVDFHIQYFIDLQRHSRPEIKSEILLRIWDTLKRAGIEIPYPQQDIYIKSLPQSPASERTGADPDSDWQHPNH